MRSRLNTGRHRGQSSSPEPRAKIPENRKIREEFKEPIHLVAQSGVHPSGAAVDPQRPHEVREWNPLEPTRGIECARPRSKSRPAAGAGKLPKGTDRRSRVVHEGECQSRDSATGAGKDGRKKNICGTQRFLFLLVASVVECPGVSMERLRPRRDWFNASALVFSYGVATPLIPINHGLWPKASAGHAHRQPAGAGEEFNGSHVPPKKRSILRARFWFRNWHSQITRIPQPSRRSARCCRVSRRLFSRSFGTQKS